MKTINEIYKELKQLRDSLEEYIKTNDTSAAKIVLISNLNIYNDILNQLEESGVLEEEKIKNREDNEDEKVEILVEGYGTETDHIEGNGTISEGARTEGKPIEYYDIEGREN